MSTQTDRLGGARGSLAYKAPCRVATTGPITLSGLQTIDGVTVVADDRVLVKDQATRSDNGIYIAAAGVWERAKDCDGSGDAVKGTRVYVYDGDLGVADYELTTANPVLFGSSVIEWQLTTVQVSQSDTAARKLPVRVATDGNITLTGLQTIGATSVIAGDRVLVWQQTNQVNNGIYVVSSGAWTRASDFTDTGSVVAGTLIYVREDAYRGDFEVTSPDTIDIGTDNITFNSLVVGDTDEFDVILLIGQSNAAGSGTGGDWIDNDNVYVWNAGYSGSTGTAAVAGNTARSAVPFALDGSNNLGIHAADKYQRATGRRVLLVVMARGGTSITEMNDVGGIIYDPMIANMEEVFDTYPNSRLVGVLWHQGEADQFETNAWYVTEFQTLLTNLRAQDWFPEDTPVVVGELYFGEYSAGAQWRQIETLSYLPLLDHRIGCVSSGGLDAVDESFTDSGGSPYRVHFTGASLRLFGHRYGGALLSMINGTYTSPKFNIHERVSYKPTGVSVEPIVIGASSSLSMTIPQLIQQPVIKCSGDATITLPNIGDLSVSSWRRALTYRFTVFCNTNSNTITINTGSSSQTISYGNVAPTTTATIVNSRTPVEFFWPGDNRWRGTRSSSS